MGGGFKLEGECKYNEDCSSLEHGWSKNQFDSNKIKYSNYRISHSEHP